MMIDDVIVTERFYLKSLSASDVGFNYVKWFEDDKIKKYIKYKLGSEKALEELQLFVETHNQRSDSVLLGIFSMCDKKHIGNIKFEPINFTKREAVVGVLIGDKNWRGLNLFEEVFSATKRFLHLNYNINTFKLGVDESNKVAIAAYNKAGFTKLPRNRKTKSFMMYCTVDTKVN